MKQLAQFDGEAHYQRPKRASAERRSWNRHANPPDDHHGPQHIAEDVAQPRREMRAVAMDYQTNRDSAKRERKIAEPQRGRCPGQGSLPALSARLDGSCNLSNQPDGVGLVQLL